MSDGMKVQLKPDTLGRLEAMAARNGALTSNSMCAMILTAFSRVEPGKLHEVLGLIGGYAPRRESPPPPARAPKGK